MIDCSFHLYSPIEFTSEDLLNLTMWNIEKQTASHKFVCAIVRIYRHTFVCDIVRIYRHKLL
jgi:hypothetical protein